MTRPSPPEGFELYHPPSTPGDEPSHDLAVYAIGPAGRPGVVLLHEAGGMSKWCVALARELANPSGGAAFRVYLPLLFGKPEQTSRLGVDVRGLFCVRREIHLLASAKTSPITTRIRRLILDIAGSTSSSRVGVIGMCLTGNLVFGLMADATVGAAVSSQPSLPFPFLWRLTPGYKRKALSVADRDLVGAVESNTPLLALRFESDWRCPWDRFESLRDAFGTAGQLTLEQVPGSGHSVLTAERTESNDRVPKVRRFLFDHLG